MLATSLSRFVAAQTDAQLANQTFGSTAPRLAVYANNVLYNRADALADAFPTVRQLVGDAFFGGMARSHARTQPSRSGDLHRYGVGFPDFIASFAPAADLPYLADCARLDWLLHSAYFADDAPSFDFTRLADLAAIDEAGLRFTRHPAAASLCSNWPVWHIWQAHQSSEASFPKLDQGGDTCLIWRKANHHPTAATLDVASWTFAHHLLEGETLDASLQAALQEDQNFQPGPTLNHLITDQLLVACYLESSL